MKAIVTERGEVTIPREAGELAGLHPGDVVEIEVEGGRLVVGREPERPTAEEIAAGIERVQGILKGKLGMTTDEYIDLVRGPLDITE